MAYWGFWPEVHPGGFCNQMEQLLGRLQCFTHDEAAERTFVFPDFRSKDLSHFEDVYDVTKLKRFARVATWREFTSNCSPVLLHETCAVEHPCSTEEAL